MISDVESNYVCFSGLILKRCPGLFESLEAVLEQRGIPYGLISGTRDIWCRDYMPIQVGKGEFVQFKYDPKYLETKEWRATKTDPKKACKAIGIKPVVSDIILDGGNVVRFKNKVIMTSQIFRDNPAYSQEELTTSLKSLLRVNEVIIIPPEPDDLFCHADGSVRFINENLVAINRPHRAHPEYDASLRKILNKHGLSWVELPYLIENDKRHEYSAVGNYVNYLAVGETVFVPAYKGHGVHNQEAVKKLSRWFKTVIPIESTELAKEGGVLNCASWEK